MSILGTSVSLTTVGPGGTPSIQYSNLFAVIQTPWGVPNVPTICTSQADFVRQFGGLNQLSSGNIKTGTTADVWTKESNANVLSGYYAVSNYLAEKGANSPGVAYIIRDVASSSGPVACAKTTTDGYLSVTSKWPGMAGSATQLTVTNPSPRKGAGFALVQVSFPQANITEYYDIANASDCATFSRNSQLVTIALTGANLPTTFATAKLFNMAAGTAPTADTFAASDADLIGTVTAAGVSTGLQAFNDYKLGSGMVIIPGQFSSAIRIGISAHCSTYYRMGLLGAPAGLTQTTVVTDLSTTNGSDLAYIWPQVWVADQNSDQGGKLLVDPVGAWAGLHARMDRDYRGPHKSAAGTSHPFNTVLDVERQSNGQELVNDAGENILADSFINCIRVKGNPPSICVFGLRTLAQDNRYRQINARRTTELVLWGMTLLLEKYAMEPIDPKGQLFASVTSDADAFLGNLLSNGSLYGTAPGSEVKSSDAYFVNCNFSNNPDIEVGQGRLHCDVWFVPTLNAEQIILNLMATAPGFVKLV